MLRGTRIFTIVVAVACLFCVTTFLYGFDEKHVQALKKTNNCKKCDLSGATLSNLDLSYADLSSANLSGSDLSNSVLSSANLTKANLSGANLTSVNFHGADLSGADVSKANLNKTYFDQATWINGKGCKVGSIGQCKQ
jgi:uncharacterized protein YjbI with pentapeptide repeats